MTQFHTDEYIDFLQRVTPDNMDSFAKEQGKYNVGDDCPVFDGLFEFCGISAGGSMEGAARLNRIRDGPRGPRSFAVRPVPPGQTCTDPAPAPAFPSVRRGATTRAKSPHRS